MQTFDEITNRGIEDVPFFSDTDLFSPTYSPCKLGKNVVNYISPEDMRSGRNEKTAVNRMLFFR